MQTVIVTPHACVRFAKLVKNKSATSPKRANKKRISAGRKKMKEIGKQQVRMANKSGLSPISITLTYRNDQDFSKRDISNFVDYLRNDVTKLGAKLVYAWVLEKAARLHYHLIVWVPIGFRITPESLEKWWPKGSNWIKKCRSPRRWVGYIGKFDYDPKKLKINLPKGARIMGYGGLDDEAKLAIQRTQFPLWLKEESAQGTANIKRVKGRWLNSDSGEIYQSPFKWTPYGFKKKEKLYMN